jgi:hypothetical protein
MARDHSLYDGQIINAFTVMVEIQRDAAQKFSMAFETFKSTADFDADGAPFGQRISFPDAQGFGTTNQALLIAIRDLLLAEMGLAGRGYTLTEFQWFPVQRVLTSSAKKADDSRVMNKRAGDHDTFIAAHVEFEQLNAAAWVYGKAHSAFLNAMTPAV